MGDQAVVEGQRQLLPDLELKLIFERLPPRDFHRCRILSRAWAAKISSEDLIDRHLRVRGKIRLDYDDIMQYLVLDSCIDVREAGNKISEEIENTDTVEEWTTTVVDGDGYGDGDDDNDGEERDWWEEYRTRGYVEVNEDYYIKRAELQAWLEEEWSKVDFSGITFADSDDEKLKACTVPFGALHPRIRQPLMQEEEEEEEEEEREEGNIMPIRVREKTQEEVDQEIIAFLKRLCNMNPKPKFLKELDTYRWPYPEPQQRQEEMAATEERPAMKMTRITRNVLPLTPNS